MGDQQMTKYRMRVETHPLEELALAFIRYNNVADFVNLAWVLSGEPVSPYDKKLDDAYRLVAQDVLNHLEAKGITYRDRYGWYRLRKVEEVKDEDAQTAGDYRG